MGGRDRRESQGGGEEGKEPAARGVGAWWLAQAGRAAAPAERTKPGWGLGGSHVRKT